MATLIVDHFVATNLQAKLKKVSFSSIRPVASPSVSNIAAMTDGVSLGRSLTTSFAELEQIMDTQADNLVRIADTFAATDAALGKGVPTL